MNIPSNIGKATLLAMCIFWTINFSKDFDLDLMPFVLLSIIPIAICVTIVVLFTVYPIFWAFKKAEKSNSIIFKKYFPYYAIITFTLCVFGIFKAEVDHYFTSFLITVFITTSQSWVWFAKEKAE